MALVVIACKSNELDGRTYFVLAYRSELSEVRRRELEPTLTDRTKDKVPDVDRHKIQKIPDLLNRPTSWMCDSCRKFAQRCSRPLLPSGPFAHYRSFNFIAGESPGGRPRPVRSGSLLVFEIVLGGPRVDRWLRLWRTCPATEESANTSNRQISKQQATLILVRNEGARCRLDRSTRWGDCASARIGRSGQAVRSVVFGQSHRA